MGYRASWAAIAAATAYVLCLPIVGTLRPQVFGMVAFVGVLWAISRLPERRRPLVWLPMLFALWANLHGSFLMGLAVVGCYAVGCTWDAWRDARDLRGAWKRPGVVRAWLALVLSTAGVCLNPLGAGLLPAVVRFSRTTNLASVSEWRPTELGSLTGELLFASLLLTALLACFSPRRMTAWEVLLLACFGYLATTSIRMLVWWGLVWPWVAAPTRRRFGKRSGLRPPDPCNADAGNMPTLQGDAGTTPTLQEAEADSKARGRTLLAAAVVFVTVMWSPPGFALLTGRHRPESSVFSPDTPYLIAEELVSQGITGRIVAPMDWADYLIWRSGGAVESMVYTHVHLSSPELWNDFLHIESGEAGWLELADRYGLRYVVVSRAATGPVVGTRPGTALPPALRRSAGAVGGDPP